MKLKHTQKKSANRSVNKASMELALMSKIRKFGWFQIGSKLTKYTKPKRRHRQREDKHLKNVSP